MVLETIKKQIEHLKQEIENVQVEMDRVDSFDSHTFSLKKKLADLRSELESNERLLVQFQTTEEKVANL